jgi:hypothetical protein
LTPSISLSYGGTSCAYATGDAGGETVAGGGGTAAVTVAAPTASKYCGTTVASSGESFTGSISLANGEVATFSGDFAA